MGDSPPAVKKVKLSSNASDFLESVHRQRLKAGESVEKFNFNKKRVKNLTSDTPEVAKDCQEGVLYWMFRDQRVHDNWGLLYAQKLALKTRLPLHVVFCLRMKFMDATLRQFDFLLKGLEEVADDLKKLDIPFHFLYTDDEHHSKTVANFVKKNKIGCVVVDFSPLKVFTSWTDSLKEHLPEGVPLCQVDSHNIVPCWEASDKLEYGARTIRGKINKKLDEYLTEFPAVAKHPHQGKLVAEKVDWDYANKHLQVYRSVGPVDWAKPGFKGGMQTLYEFTEKRLKTFAEKRNNPLVNTLSNLSPWLHFGQISAQRCILHVRTFKSKYKESVEAYCEEAIIRRELSDNFCFYNKNYDNLAGAYAWAKESLDLHRKDKREYVYTKEEFEKALTHDDLWNSAQIQLNKEGKMHGFLRMYWAKKILEWTTGPEEALSIALYLNDKYSVDGRDPSGFVGCMWSICGVHDQGWREREVFGKIRFMNYKGCERKFDVKAFVARYGGKVHKKSSKK